jgi:type I restriction enzyme, S subunit
MQRHESYKPSGVKWLGDVPSHWDVQALRAVTQLKSDRNRPDLPVLSVYREYGVIRKDSRDDNHNATSLDTSTYKVVQPGDLVVNKMKAWQGSMGVSAHEGIVSPAYITCATKSEQVLPGYLHYLLRSSSLIGVYNSLSYGVRVGQWDMHYEDFKQIRIPLPPTDEQDRIVKFLNKKIAEIDDTIAQKERLIELLFEQRAAVITKETRGVNKHTQTSRDSNIAWLGRIPANHRLTRLGFIAKVGNGSTPNRSVLGYWNGGAIPWMNSSKVNDFEIIEADQFVTNRAARECHLPVVKAGSLLIAITGEGKTRGMSAITRIDTTINQHLAHISVTDPQVDPEFLLYYLTGIYQILRDESSAQGSTKGAITCGELAKVPVLIPPLEDQRSALVHIKNQLQQVDQSRDVTQRQIDALQVFRSTLLSHAVSGKMKI